MEDSIGLKTGSIKKASKMIKISGFQFAKRKPCEYCTIGHSCHEKTLKDETLVKSGENQADQPQNNKV